MAEKCFQEYFKKKKERKGRGKKGRKAKQVRERERAVSLKNDKEPVGLCLLRVIDGADQDAGLLSYSYQLALAASPI